MLSDGLAATRPMNRLLQGEVGSGKTIVAVLAMLQMVDAGYQCALLAPTEVLAAQHLRSIRDVLGPLAMGGQLGGADDADPGGAAHRIDDGGAEEARSAPRSPAVRPASSSARTRCCRTRWNSTTWAWWWSTSSTASVSSSETSCAPRHLTGITPHLLVMTATPIPRTVALTVYGDLETSTLRELPRGRQPITTNVIFVKDKPAWLDRAWQRIVEEVARRPAGLRGGAPHRRGRRIRRTGKRTRARRRPPRVFSPGCAPVSWRTCGWGSCTDGCPPTRRTPRWRPSGSGEIDVLVCTTVIEVGVDVPNATVMVVMDADRFGISQLHQLRGRIGRGEHPSLCLLASWSSPGSPGRPAAQCRRRDAGRFRPRRPGSQGAPGRRCAGPQPVR